MSTTLSESAADLAVGSTIGPDELGQALLGVARGLWALKLSPQRLGFDRRVDRGAYLALQRINGAGSIRLSDVASGLCLDLSTVSRQVRTLEDAGLVTRSPDPDDRRASLLTATPEGTALVGRMQATLSQIVNRALGDWSERDRSTLTALLGRLAEDISPDRAPSLVATVLGAEA